MTAQLDGPALFCLSGEFFSRLFLSARRSRDGLSALYSPSIMGSRTQTCKMARPAVATQTPSMLVAATATGSHMPAMVSRRGAPRSRTTLLSRVTPLAWPANNSDNAAACALAQRRVIPRLRSAAVL